jgi:hypothetical protein
MKVYLSAEKIQSIRLPRKQMATDLYACINVPGDIKAMQTL